MVNEERREVKRGSRSGVADGAEADPEFFQQESPPQGPGRKNDLDGGKRVRRFSEG